MDIFNYQPDTGEFVGQSTARIDPLETEAQGQNVYLIPANATTVAPPAAPDGKAAVFDGVAWALVDDYRGQTIYGPDDETKEVEALGPIDDGWSLTAPTPPVPTLAEEKADKKAALAAKRYAVEAGGITVGQTPVKTDRETQAILTGARTLAKEDPAYSVNWKTPGGFVTMDAATIIAVADAVAAHVQACFDNEMNITAQIDAAADVAAVRAIDLEAGW